MQFDTVKYVTNKMHPSIQAGVVDDGSQKKQKKLSRSHCTTVLQDHCIYYLTTHHI